MSKSVSRASSISSIEFSELTLLQEAAHEGNLVEVKNLINSGMDYNLGPNTALHLALRKQHANVALYLLDIGCNYDSRDYQEDCPIHIACKVGLVDVVYTLCTLGCNIEVPNARGLYPLHLAARHGHINVVRCLCVAGCNLDVRNADNIRADITALKYGHNDIADLLDKLRATGQRDFLCRQLVPTSKPLAKPVLRVLGNCGVGKTALIKSLQAGLFSSLFKRSSSLQSNKSRPSSPINTNIEMDVTSRQNSLTFECTADYESTRGIHIQNLDINSVGEVTAIEFSGQKNYFPVYHHFLRPNPCTLTLILFNLEDSVATQTKQVNFWINFLMARETSEETADLGAIMLVATHVDTTRAVKTQTGEWISSDAIKVYNNIENLNSDVQNLLPNMAVMDCNVPASYAFKQIKAELSIVKQGPMKEIYTWTGLLESTLSWLTSLRKDYEQFPVLRKEAFYNLLRNHVNLLASDDNIEELLYQLQNMGEIFYIENLVIVSFPWLGFNLIGELLSTEFLASVRPTGVYTSEDFQACFNHCDALGTLELLEALRLCIKCEVDGEIEYEFPIYNHTETLPGLWDSSDPRYRTTDACYGGVRLFSPPTTCYMFHSIFPYIQVELRRANLESFSNSDNDTDLYQWYHGSKLCTITLESLITLEQEEDTEEYIEIKIRGPRQSSQYCFYFFEDILTTVMDIIEFLCPGLIVERYILSPQQLRIHSTVIHCYSSEELCTAFIDNDSVLDITFCNSVTSKNESVKQLILFNDEELASNIQWGRDLKVSNLSMPTKIKLARMLDLEESFGKDWCLLAVKLGINPEMIESSAESKFRSSTMQLLTVADCNIGNLIKRLYEIGRSEVAKIVVRSAPPYKIIKHLDL